MAELKINSQILRFPRAFALVLALASVSVPIDARALPAAPKPSTIVIPAQSYAAGMRSGAQLPETLHTGTVRARARNLDDSIGVCACGIDADAREAQFRPIGKTSVKDLHGERIPISVVNFDYALKIFHYLVRQEHIPFGFPQDGCFARAHEMSYLLENQGIITAKVMALGAFRVESSLLPKGAVSWAYHVAPVIAVDDGTGRRLWVLDPSLFSEPVPMEMWLSVLTRHPRARIQDVFLTSRFVLHPNFKDVRYKTWSPAHLRTARRLMKRIAEHRFEATPAAQQSAQSAGAAQGQSQSQSQSQSPTQSQGP